MQADLEWGLYPGGSQSWNPNQRAFTSKFVTAMLKNNGTSRFAIKGGNAQSGSLNTLWDGALPSGYSPMKKQGAIVLGSGGDCCKPGGGANLSAGTFYEGAMVVGLPVRRHRERGTGQHRRRRLPLSTHVDMHASPAPKLPEGARRRVEERHGTARNVVPRDRPYPHLCGFRPANLVPELFRNILPAPGGARQYRS